MNQRFPPRGLFVTGTDTEVGKTWVASLLAKSLVSAGHTVGVYKPAASGGRMEQGLCVCDDAVHLWNAAGKPGSIHEVCPQMFELPVAPHLAAIAEGKSIDESLLTDGLEKWRDQCDIVIVEGAGGWMSPISENLYIADIAERIGYPVLIVTANRLGTINQTLQTELAVASRVGKEKIAGIIVNDVCEPSTGAEDVNDPSQQSNADEIRKRIDVPFLGHVKWNQQDVPREMLEKIFG